MNISGLLLLLLSVEWRVAAIKEDHMANVGHRCFCEKGFKLVLPCNKTEPATCRKCGKHEFQDERNEERNCKRCTHCPRSSVATVSCSRTQDAECTCTATDHHFSKLKGFCVKCTTCQPGFETIGHCSFLHDRKCRKCPAGTFSRSAKRCRPCKICSVYNTHCNRTHDAVCLKVASTPLPPDAKDKQKGSEEVWLKVFVPSVTVLLIGSLLFCVCYKCKRLRGTCSRRLERRARPDLEIPLQENNPVPGPSENSELWSGHHDPKMKVTALPYSVIINLAVKLNGKCKRNWVLLASEMNVSVDLIRCWKQEPLEATQRLLDEYATHDKSSVLGLYDLLVKIDRHDAAKLLKPFLQGNETT